MHTSRSLSIQIIRNIWYFSGRQVLSVHLPPIRSISSPKSIYQAILLKPIVGSDRMSPGHLLGDILILHQDNNQLDQITLSACQLSEHLGLLVKNKKSVLTSCQQLEFLGFQLCTMTLRISVPSEKLKMRKI